MTELSVTALPVLPLRDIVVFPHMIVPLFVGREKSIKALEAVMAEDKQIILATQTEAGIEDPDADGLYTTGTLGTILQLLKLPDGAVKVLVEGGERLHLRRDTLPVIKAICLSRQNWLSKLVIAALIRLRLAVRQSSSLNNILS